MSSGWSTVGRRWRSSSMQIMKNFIFKINKFLGDDLIDVLGRDYKDTDKFVLMKISQKIWWKWYDLRLWRKNT